MKDYNCVSSSFPRKRAKAGIQSDKLVPNRGGLWTPLSRG